MGEGTERVRASKAGNERDWSLDINNLVLLMKYVAGDGYMKSFRLWVQDKYLQLLVKVLQAHFLGTSYPEQGEAASRIVSLQGKVH